MAIAMKAAASIWTNLTRNASPETRSSRAGTMADSKMAIRYAKMHHAPASNVTATRTVSGVSPPKIGIFFSEVIFIPMGSFAAAGMPLALGWRRRGRRRESIVAA